MCLFPMCLFHATLLHRSLLDELSGISTLRRARDGATDAAAVKRRRMPNGADNERKE
jgi:hypothetical protein